MSWRLARRRRRLSYCRAFNRLTHLLDMPRRRRTKLPKILAAELGGAFVSDGEGGIRRGVAACQQQLAGFLQSEVLLILKRTEASYRQEMAMQACAADAAGIAKGIDAKVRVGMISDPRDGAPDAFQGTFRPCDLTQQSPLRAFDRDATLFESMVICEYLEETQGGGKLYPEDALSRARQRAWIEYGTATLAEAWQFLNAKDRATADAKRAAFRGRLERLEEVLEQGPYFAGLMFSMVDVVFAPLFRYFDLINPTVTQMIFQGLPRVSLWREALALRESVAAAVGRDYGHRFKQHLVEHQAILAD